MDIVILIFGLLVLALIVALVKRKKRTVAQFPEPWHGLLESHVHFYKSLPPEEQKRFQQRMMQFLSEVYVEGVQLELEDLDRVLVAASAVIPVFGFPEWRYTNLSGVLLYPDYFNEDLEFANGADSKQIGGLVGTGRFENQMILSQRALRHGFQNTTDKHNTGIHEFVHLIDKVDGVTDGVPERLLQHQYAIPWLKLVHREMEAIQKNKSDIRPYGATNEAEFLAVASEYFFERPELFKRKHPELYEVLEGCFHPNVL